MRINLMKYQCRGPYNMPYIRWQPFDAISFVENESIAQICSSDASIDIAHDPLVGMSLAVGATKPPLSEAFPFILPPVKR